jgi:hypothetical protein
MDEFQAKRESPTDLSKPADPLRATADKALAAGRDVQAAAVDLAHSSSDALKGHASEFAEAAKGIASQAGDRLQEKVAEQKGVGVAYVNNLADTMRRAAGEFDADIPLAGTYIRKAAAQVDSAADALREGNFNDLVRGAQSFARNQPTAFLGLAVLAGFGVVRFLKSSSGSQMDNEMESGGDDFRQHRHLNHETASHGYHN